MSAFHMPLIPEENTEVGGSRVPYCVVIMLCNNELLIQIQVFQSSRAQLRPNAGHNFQTSISQTSSKILNQTCVLVCA